MLLEPLVDAVVRSVCAPAYAEALRGDLQERHAERLAQQGWRANLTLLGELAWLMLARPGLGPDTVSPYREDHNGLFLAACGFIWISKALSAPGQLDALVALAPLAIAAWVISVRMTTGLQKCAARRRAHRRAALTALAALLPMSWIVRHLDPPFNLPGIFYLSLFGYYAASTYRLRQPYVVLLAAMAVLVAFRDTAVWSESASPVDPIGSWVIGTALVLWGLAEHVELRRYLQTLRDGTSSTSTV